MGFARGIFVAGDKGGSAMLEIILNVLGDLAAALVILFCVGLFLHRVFG